MTFSKEWEERYKEGAHLSVWPWSDLVSYVNRYMKPQGRKLRVLELGCGAGANIRFFKEIGADFFSVEGSSFMVKQLWKRYPGLKKNIVTGDFTKDIKFKGSFDLVVDRGSLCHNTETSIKRCLRLVRGRLNTSGAYVGIDWFSTANKYFKKGKPGGDKFTRKGFTEGPFAGLGRLHFSDERHLKELFMGFTFEALEHKVTQQIKPAAYTDARWNFFVRKDGSR